MSGVERVVSSVTYITGQPFLTEKVTASRVCFSILSRSQSSTYWRTGLDPMKACVSIGMPTRCEISTMGRMSETTVRAAQPGRSAILQSTISRTMRSTSRATFCPAPGSPTSAMWMPRSSIKWRISSFWSIVGWVTEGDCSPSRSVSSSSSTSAFIVCGDAWFQSWISACFFIVEPP